MLRTEVLRVAEELAQLALERPVVVERLPPLEERALPEHLLAEAPIELQQLPRGQPASQPGGDDGAGAGAADAIEELAQAEVVAPAQGLAEQGFEPDQNGKRDQPADPAAVEGEHPVRAAGGRPGLVAVPERPPQLPPAITHRLTHDVSREPRREELGQPRGARLDVEDVEEVLVGLRTQRGDGLPELTRPRLRRIDPADARHEGVGDPAAPGHDAPWAAAARRCVPPRRA